MSEHKEIEHEHSGHRKRNWALNFYDKRYKELMILTFVILFLSIGLIAYTYFTTGDFLNRGVSLKGGSTITIQEVPNTNPVDLQLKLSQTYPELEVSVRSITDSGRQTGLIIDTSAKEENDVNSLLSSLKSDGIVYEKTSSKDKNYSIETFGSSLGPDFFKQAMIGLLFSFILMSIVVFITFRDIVPSFFVILAAFSDIVNTWAVVLLLGTKVSTAGLAAFVMLILYSVDTDILLTTRVLKRKEGTILDRTLNSMGTGLTMTLTALTVTIISYFISESEIIQQIMLILSIGLFFDILNTWIQNAGILRWHLENKEKKHEQK